jgi:hypothetical protein
MSTYRILLQNQRIATAAALKDGSFYQVYPEKENVPNLYTWVFCILTKYAKDAKSFTIRYPDGKEVTYFAENYSLFREDELVSAGYRLGTMFVECFPRNDRFVNKASLLVERAPCFEEETSLEVYVKSPQVVPAPSPAPKEKRRRTLTPNQVKRLQAYRTLAAARRALMHAEEVYERSGHTKETMALFVQATDTFEQIETLLRQLPRI